MASTYSNRAADCHGRPAQSGKSKGDSAPQRRPARFRGKAVMDLAVALLLLLPAGAVIAILTLLVRATSKGPGLDRRLRVGKGGRRFTMFKIRTMIVDAERGGTPPGTQPGDPRVTPLGRILRKLHLDELPQIFNVLRGEMSLVGPRPERPEFAAVLSEAIPRYRDRLAVRPGITGLAQIDLPPDTDLMSARRKLLLDLDYIECGSLWLDARLLLCAALRIVKIPEDLLTRALGLRRPAQLALLERTIEAPSKPEEAAPATLSPQAVSAASPDGRLTTLPITSPNS
jgi:lipopolysaccharide/colanic/teichoic acid biosynthesis glycosyltransferase